MAKLIYTYDDPPAEKHIAEAVKILNNGGLIAYPTDVNWAIGGSALQGAVLDRMRRIKPGKPKEQPFSMICKDISMISQVAYVQASSYRSLKKALPGPYTLLLERNRSLPKFLKDKRKVVGVRVPDSRLLLALVDALGSPLLSSSAPELPDGRLPKFGYEIEESWGHALDLILDLGNESPWSETSIIDLSEGEAEIIREGAGDLSFFR